MSIISYGICSDDTVSAETLFAVVPAMHKRQGMGWSLKHWSEHSGQYQLGVWRATKRDALEDRAALCEAALASDVA